MCKFPKKKFDKNFNQLTKKCYKLYGFIYTGLV